VVLLKNVFGLCTFKVYWITRISFIYIVNGQKIPNKRIIITSWKNYKKINQQYEGPTLAIFVVYIYIYLLLKRKGISNIYFTQKKIIKSRFSPRVKLSGTFLHPGWLNLESNVVVNFGGVKKKRNKTRSGYAHLHTQRVRESEHECESVAKVGGDARCTNMDLCK